MKWENFLQALRAQLTRHFLVPRFPHPSYPPVEPPKLFPLSPKKSTGGKGAFLRLKYQNQSLDDFLILQQKTVFWQLHGGTKQPTNIAYYTCSPWFVFTCNYISIPWWYPRPTKTAEWIVPGVFFPRGLHSPKINWLWNFTGIVGGGYPQSIPNSHFFKKKHERNVTWTQLAKPRFRFAVSPCTLGICILTALSCQPFVG